MSKAKASIFFALKKCPARNLSDLHIPNEGRNNQKKIQKSMDGLVQFVAVLKTKAIV